MTDAGGTQGARADRAVGVLLGTAAGDALGAPYEFQPSRGPELPVVMKGGGSFGWAPGEWTDDTSMAIAIAEVAADGLDLRTGQAQNRIVVRWHDWARTAKDVGNQTRAVLRGLDAPDAPSARAAARRHHDRTGQSGGNGSLMRTAPVVLAYLDDEDALAEAAAAISVLTHFDPEAAEACVLWCLAMRNAVVTGEADIRVGLDRLPSDRRAVWTARVEAAEAARPNEFTHNGWVVEAFQAAWSAVAGSTDLATGLDAAVRCGNDTDTVAAIAGGVLGATYGASAIPPDWRTPLHGWPGITGADLVTMAAAIIG